MTAVPSNAGGVCAVTGQYAPHAQESISQEFTRTKMLNGNLCGIGSRGILPRVWDCFQMLIEESTGDGGYRRKYLLWAWFRRHWSERVDAGVSTREK